MERGPEEIIALAEYLLRIAGMPGDVERVSRFSTGYTNEMWSVCLRSGDQVVLRRYQWPHDSPDLDRLQKEVFLHDQLGKHGVPVARVLSHAQEKQSAAMLLEYLPGELLGDICMSLTPGACDQAWFSCGQALRRAHAITYPAGTSGVIVGDRIQPAVSETWGHWQMYNLVHHARQMKNSHGVRVDIEHLQCLCERALPFLNNHQPCLLHNDLHPWNVLVTQVDGTWTCSGWLDWEYAWVGDPTWDLTRMDLWRTKPIGQTPDAFWKGYGKHPMEPNRSIYQMSLYLWQANEALTSSDDRLTATRCQALEYVTCLDEHIQRLQMQLEQNEIA